MKLKQIKISNIKDYKCFEIPNADKNEIILFSTGDDYLTIGGFEKDRKIWWRLGDRMDLRPEKLKHFGLTSYRGSDKAGREKFINRLIKAYE